MAKFIAAAWLIVVVGGLFFHLGRTMHREGILVPVLIAYGLFFSTGIAVIVMVGR